MRINDDSSYRSSKLAQAINDIITEGQIMRNRTTQTENETITELFGTGDIEKREIVGFDETTVTHPTTGKPATMQSTPKLRELAAEHHMGMFDYAHAVFTDPERVNFPAHLRRDTIEGKRRLIATTIKNNADAIFDALNTAFDQGTSYVAIPTNVLACIIMNEYDQQAALEKQAPAGRPSASPLGTTDELLTLIKQGDALQATIDARDEPNLDDVTAMMALIGQAIAHMEALGAKQGGSPPVQTAELHALRAELEALRAMVALVQTLQKKAAPYPPNPVEG